MPRPRSAATLTAAALALALMAAAGILSVAHATSPPAGGRAAPPRPDAATSPATIAAGPLRWVAAPDLLVSLHRPARRVAVRRLSSQRGIAHVAVLDRGRIRIRGHRLAAIGVDPGEIRGFTPTLTARSDPLWQAVAAGDLAVAYGSSRPLRHRLGRSVTVHGRRTASVRVGAFASFGIGRASAVVDRPTARVLGLRRARALLVAAPHLSVSSIVARVQHVFGAQVRVHRLRPASVDDGVSAYARATIPASYLALYRNAAATCPGLPWTVLAGIGAVETDHGANNHRSSKGAVGPMQFLPSTFAAYGIDADGDGVADVNDPADAVYSAARYLCLWGGGRGGQSLYDAVFAYNHADWYVRLVFDYANAYV